MQPVLEKLNNMHIRKISYALTLVAVLAISTQAIAQSSTNEKKATNKNRVLGVESTHSGQVHGEMQHGDIKHDVLKPSQSVHVEHKHSPVSVDDWPDTPSLTMTAYKDLMSGWNLHIVLSSFTFAPNRVNAAVKPGEGHGHLYINGEKVTRLYSEWYYINPLPPGRHIVTVSLNANNHGPLTLNGQTVEASVEIVQE